MNGVAVPVPGITTDIDGETRNALTPDIGADEFTPSPYNLSTLEILTPIGACGLDTNEVVSIRIKNVRKCKCNRWVTASLIR